MNNSDEKKRILIIVNSNNLQLCMLKMLAVNYNITKINGSSANLKLGSMAEPDLILFQLSVPRDAEEMKLIQLIRKDSQLADKPMIILCTTDNADILLEGLECGANDIISNKVTPRELELKIKNQISIRENLKKRIRNEEILKISPVGIMRDQFREFELRIENAIRIEKKISIASFAKEMNLSQSSLERIIKRKYGISPNRFIMNKKLEKANMMLLGKKGLSIKEISYALGFNNVSYFSRCFKAFFGYTPSSTQKEIREEADPITDFIQEDLSKNQPQLSF